MADTWKEGDTAWVWSTGTQKPEEVKIITVMGRECRYTDGGWLKWGKASALSTTPEGAAKRQVRLLRETARRRDKKVRDLLNEKHILIRRADQIWEQYLKERDAS